MSQPVDWRAALQEWLKNNPKTMPPDLVELHQEFLRRFPRETIGKMALEQYTLGHDDYKNSFCYWLEWETSLLGSVRGGSSAKWGIWWSNEEKVWKHNRAFPSAQAGLNRLKEGMLALFTAVDSDAFHQLDSIGDRQLGQNRNSLRSKPLYLYFPDKFLPISNPTHLANILRAFEQEPQKGLHTRNRQLLKHLRTLPEFDGFDTLQIMRFLYTYKFQHKAVIFTNQQALQTAIQGFVRFANSTRYNREEYNYKNELLQAFNEAISIILNEDSEQTRDELVAWLKKYRDSINNLTSWQTTDNLSKYLQHVPAAQIQQNLVALLDEDGDVGERIDAFRESIETDFQTYMEQKKNITIRFDFPVPHGLGSKYACHLPCFNH